MKSKLLILSVSAGAGHVRAAQAIQATAKLYYPELVVEHLDLMTLVPEHFKKIYADSYIKVVERHPALWGYLYHLTDKQKKDSALNKVLKAIKDINTTRIIKTLEKSNADYVICTHFLPAEILSRRIKKNKWMKPVYVQVTDFDLHSLWIHEGMTGYFAASEEIAWRMVERGISKERIFITGIPIMPVFSADYDRPTCAKELGINPQKTTLLLMSGGAGISGIELIAQRLLDLPSDLQIVALAGKNQKLLQLLQNLAKKYPQRLYPQGFTTTIERVMTCADFAITKPGGLTTSECLAMALPMIVVSPIPGQEERNADYLMEQGVAVKAHDLAGLEYKTNLLLKNPKMIEEMSNRMKLIRKPGAAKKVLEIVLA